MPRDYSGENKVKMLAKMAKDMHWTNDPDYKRFMNDLEHKVGPYRSLVEYAKDRDTERYLELGDEYFKSCVESELEKICEWEYDYNFIYRMKKYSPQAWEDIVERSTQIVKDNLKENNMIKSSYNKDKLWEIAYRYNGADPVSGSWDTETEHELNAIARELHISKEEAKQLMIKELGFDEDMFDGIKSSKNINSSHNGENVCGMCSEDSDILVEDLKEAFGQEGYNMDIVNEFFDDKELDDYDSLCYDCESSIRKEFEKYNLNRTSAYSAANKKKKKWVHPDERAKDEGADITCSCKSIRSEVDPYAELPNPVFLYKLVQKHFARSEFEGLSRDEIEKKILDKLGDPDLTYEDFKEVADRVYEELNPVTSSRKVIKSALTQKQKTQVLDYIKKNTFFPCDNGESFFFIVPIDEEHIKMTPKFKKQLEDEGLYGNVYYGGMCDNPKLPINMEWLPIYGDSNKYVTKWFRYSYDSAFDDRLRERSFGLSKRLDLDTLNLNSSCKPIKSSVITFEEAVEEFKTTGPWNDYWEMQQEWEGFKDSLVKSGDVEQEEESKWGNPCTPETFDDWNPEEDYDDEIQGTPYDFDDEDYDYGDWESGKPQYSSRKINSSVYDEVDPNAVEDLYLTIINDGELYDGIIRWTVNNLKKHNGRGRYDKDKALVSWMRVADEGAKKYDKQFGSGHGSTKMFTPATRKEVAKKLMEYYEDNVLGGENF